MKKEPVEISIVTPSLNMIEYLKGCVASIADQEGVLTEHIVIDGGSTDGSVEWLKNRKNIRFLTEPDEGMYDALNKGFRLAGGDVLGYLNCDEQYLPGTLSCVHRYFENHPEVDLVFGNILLIEPDGSLLAFRKGYPLRWQYILTSHLYNFSCAIFFRRKLLDLGFCFNSKMKAVGDMDFFVRLLRNGIKTVHIRRYLSAFIMTGNNMGFHHDALKELNQLKKKAPPYIIRGSIFINMIRLMRKFLHGSYFQGASIEYSVYPVGADIERKEYSVVRASPKWPKKKNNNTHEKKKGSP